MSGRAINPCVNTAGSAVYTWTRENTNAARTIRARDTSRMIHTSERKMGQRKRKKDIGREKKRREREKVGLYPAEPWLSDEGGSLPVNFPPCD